MISLRTMMMRGGTSSGVYLLKSDLDETGLEPDVLLSAILGSLDRRQVDRFGGDGSTTTKVAIVGPSSRPDCDVDYLFAQVDLATLWVDWTLTCGNLLAGVAPFAIERGLIAPADPYTAVRVHLVNTGATVMVSVGTPGACLHYDAGCQIAGVPGQAAPVDLVFSNFCGGRTGELFPTGHLVDQIGDVEITAIDAGVCAIIADARAFGITGSESPRQLNRDPGLLDRLARLRLRAALAMGLGDPRGYVLPKVLLVSESECGDVRSRYFVPDRCHTAHAVSAAICLATASAVPDTVAGRLINRPFRARPIVVEHPTGTMTIDITRAGDSDRGIWAAVRSTAQKLFDGYVFADMYREPCLIGAVGAGVT
jgi:2-methylaconitate cis-trans-isomerase PrpF